MYDILYEHLIIIITSHKQNLTYLSIYTFYIIILDIF